MMENDDFVIVGRDGECSFAHSKSYVDQLCTGDSGSELSNDDIPQSSGPPRIRDELR